MERDQIFLLLRAAFPFRGLCDRELKGLMPLLKPRICYLPEDAVLAESSTPADFMGIVTGGRLQARRATMTGNIYIAAEYRPGALFGDNAVYSTPGTWPLSIMAAEDSAVLLFSMGELLRTQNPDPAARIAQAMLAKTMDDKNKEIIHQITLAALTVRGRILTFFDLMNDKHEGRPFHFQMSRDRFAEYLGIGRSSLFREMSALRACGAVVIDRRRMVTVDGEAFSRAMEQENC